MQRDGHSIDGVTLPPTCIIANLDVLLARRTHPPLGRAFRKEEGLAYLPGPELFAKPAISGPHC
jgi:hypothetical protein